MVAGRPAKLEALGFTCHIIMASCEFEDNDASEGPAHVLGGHSPTSKTSWTRRRTPTNPSVVMAAAAIP